MPSTNPSQVPPKQSVEFLFLASHGLLSPISAIRWGCNRLRRTDTRNLSKEQQDLLHHVYSNAKTLSKLFGSMLLLARNEDQTYTLRPEATELLDVLKSEAKEWEEQESGTVTLDCPADLSVRCDTAILEAVLQNLFAVFSEAMQPPKSLRITASREGDMVQVAFTGKLELPFLQSVRTLERNSSETRPVVGGTPGLLLSLAHSLVGFIEGTLFMKETGADTYSIVTALPSSTSV